MLNKIDKDSYIITWDWKETVDAIELNKVMKENPSRMPKFFNMDSGADDYSLFVTFNLDMTESEARELFIKHY